MKVKGLSKEELRGASKLELLKLFKNREDIYARQNKIIEEIELSSEFKKAQVILCYYPLADEFDLTSLIISNPQKTWLLPRAIGKRIMLLFEVNELHELIDSKFSKVTPVTNKFYKPEEVDMAIIPGLAFDKRGYRLGRGMAYYDRLLAKFNPKTFTLGVIAKELLLDSLPNDSHDFPVKRVLSF